MSRSTMKPVSSPARPLPPGLLSSSSPPPALHHPFSPSAGSRRRRPLAVRVDVHLQALLPRARAGRRGRAAAAEPLRAAERALIRSGRGLPVRLPGGAVQAEDGPSAGRKVPVSMEIRVRKTPLGWDDDSGIHGSEPYYGCAFTLKLFVLLAVIDCSLVTLTAMAGWMIDGWVGVWMDGSANGCFRRWLDG